MSLSQFYPYLSQFSYVLMANFEFWGVFETNLGEAVLGLLAYQLLEDAIAYIIYLTFSRNAKYWSLD